MTPPDRNPTNTTAPMRYRKKPIEVDAMQLTVANVEAIGDWAMNGLAAGGRTDEFLTGQGPGSHSYLDIVTPEGTMRAHIGDWIIRGVKGEFYPCKPDIFEATYEAVVTPDGLAEAEGGSRA